MGRKLKWQKPYSGSRMCTRSLRPLSLTRSIESMHPRRHECTNARMHECTNAHLPR